MTPRPPSDAPHPHRTGPPAAVEPTETETETGPEPVDQETP